MLRQLGTLRFLPYILESHVTRSLLPIGDDDDDDERLPPLNRGGGAKIAGTSRFGDDIGVSEEGGGGDVTTVCGYDKTQSTSWKNMGPYMGNPGGHGTATFLTSLNPPNF